MKSLTEAAPLLTLGDEVLGEIVREAEQRLQAQIVVATAADQRALTLVGFQVSISTAVLTATLALALSDNPDRVICGIGFFLTVTLLVAAFYGIDSIRPKDFSFPGNFPSLWLPHNWLCHGSPITPTLQQARVEQCICLEKALNENQSSMEKAAQDIKLSIDLCFWGVSSSAVLTSTYCIKFLVF